MGRFVAAVDRQQPSLLPSCLDDYVGADNPVRVIDAFVDELDLTSLGFLRVQPAATGRPGYAPGMTMLWRSRPRASSSSLSVGRLV